MILIEDVVVKGVCGEPLSLEERLMVHMVLINRWPMDTVSMRAIMGHWYCSTLRRIRRLLKGLADRGYVSQERVGRHLFWTPWPTSDWLLEQGLLPLDLH
jgi:hypothetical protein